MRVSHAVIWWLHLWSVSVVINGPASAAGDCDGRNPGSKLTNIQHFRVYFGRYDGAVQCPSSRTRHVSGRLGWYLDCWLCHVNKMSYEYSKKLSIQFWFNHFDGLLTYHYQLLLSKYLNTYCTVDCRCLCIANIFCQLNCVLHHSKLLQ